MIEAMGAPSSWAEITIDSFGFRGISSGNRAAADASFGGDDEFEKLPRLGSPLRFQGFYSGDPEGVVAAVDC